MLPNNISCLSSCRGKDHFFFPPKPLTPPVTWSHVPQPPPALGARSQVSQGSELDSWIQGSTQPARKEKESLDTSEARDQRHIVPCSHSHKDTARQRLRLFPGSNRFFKNPLTHRGFFNKTLFEKKIKLGFC